MALSDVVKPRLDVFELLRPHLPRRRRTLLSSRKFRKRIQHLTDILRQHR